MYNQIMMDEFPKLTVTHLIIKGSDYSPLELQISADTKRIIKPFKFLNFWVQHGSLRKVVGDH